MSSSGGLSNPMGGNTNGNKNAVKALKLNSVNISNGKIKNYIKNGTPINNLNIKQNNKVNNNNNRLKKYYKINFNTNLNNKVKLEGIDPKTYSSELFHELFSKTGKVIEKLASNTTNNKYRVFDDLRDKWNILTAAFQGEIFIKFPKNMKNNKLGNTPHGGFFVRKMGIYKTNNSNKAKKFKDRFNKIKQYNKSILRNGFINTSGTNNGLPERGKVLIVILVFINNFLKKHKDMYNRAIKVYGAMNRQKGELALEKGRAINTVSGFNNMVMNVVEAINKLVKVTESNNATAPSTAPANANATAPANANATATAPANATATATAPATSTTPANANSKALN